MCLFSFLISGFHCFHILCVSCSRLRVPTRTRYGSNFMDFSEECVHVIWPQTQSQYRYNYYCCILWNAFLALQIFSWSNINHSIQLLCGFIQQRGSEISVVFFRNRLFAMTWNARFKILLFRDATCAGSDAIQTTQRGVSNAVSRLGADFFFSRASRVKLCYCIFCWHEWRTKLF
jgi:hypothetical protein